MLRLRRRVPPVIALAWAALCFSSGAAQAAPTISFDAVPFGHVFVEGETPVIDVTVTADAAGHRGRLVVLAIDAYGRRAGRLATTIDLEPGTSTTVPLTLRPRGLGYFDVIASLSGKGARVRRVTAAAIVPPILDTPAEPSAVGYFVYPVGDVWTQADQIAAQMRRLGIRWVRYGFHGWDDARRVALDPSDPAWLDSTIYERWVDAFRRQGIEVLATVFGLPRWASSQPDDETFVSGVPRWALVAPRDLAEWGAIMRALAGRFAGKVRHWEVWNEPNYLYYWQASADDFANLVRATAAAVRDVDPTARVAVGFAPSEYGPFERAVVEGAGDQIDLFGWHYAQRANVEAAHALLPQLRPGAAIWDTEATGAPRRHVNRWLEERAAGAERIFPFVYRLPDDEEVTGLGRFGRYPVNVDYSPRRDALALRTLSDNVGDAPSFIRAEAGVGYSTFIAPNGVTVLVDMNEGDVTWLGARGIDLMIEVPKTVKGLDATDLMGNRRSVRVRRGKARIRSYGIAEFLRADPPDALTSVRVTRVRRRR
jgi:hypothetical protein